MVIVPLTWFPNSHYKAAPINSGLFNGLALICDFYDCLQEQDSNTTEIKRKHTALAANGDSS